MSNVQPNSLFKSHNTVEYTVRTSLHCCCSDYCRSGCSKSSADWLATVPLATRNVWSTRCMIIMYDFCVCNWLKFKWVQSNEAIRVKECSACAAEQGLPQKWVPQIRDNVLQKCDIFWPMGPLYGVLWHLKVHLVQHNIFSGLGLCTPYCEMWNFRIQTAASQIR